MAITMATLRMDQHYFGISPGPFPVLVSDVDGVGDVLRTGGKRLSNA